MAKLLSTPQVTTTITLVLSEEEARALLALTEYGEDNFLRVFYNSLGTHHLSDHEAGLRSLFQSVDNYLHPIFNKLKKAREVFNG